MTRIHFLLFLFASLAALVAGAAPTFCKCTCFSNSTIIKLGPGKDNPMAPPTQPDAPKDDSTTSTTSTSSSSAPASSASAAADAAPTSPALPRSVLDARAASASCAQCNRKFCLEYNLPICKDAEEKDVVTSCFQRDSTKDQIIVWGFILGTAGLLGWAGVRRVLEMREGKPVALGGGLGSSLPTGGAGRTGLGVSGLVRRAVGASGAGGTAARGAYSPLHPPNEEGITDRGPD